MITNRQIADLIYNRACGTPQDVMMTIDYMIEDEEFTAEQFYSNELEILGLLDDHMFCCGVCGWNHESSEVSLEASDRGNLVCRNCGDYNES